MPQQLFIATRKGAFIATAANGRSDWTLSDPTFLGHQCHHMVLDPRDGHTILLAARQWHIGPTVFRSDDGGATFKEAATPPAFDKGDPKGRAVDHVFWLTPGPKDEPGVWYCGTSPQGIFRSEDGGRTWQGVQGFNLGVDSALWMGNEKDQTPDGTKTHSILVDPRDANHLYVGLSGGGIFESQDCGATWRPMIKGVDMDFMPPKPDGSEYEYGGDPHCIVQHPAMPDRLYMQNHCGIYRLDRPAERWTRIGKNMPKEIGDVGFPIVVHPRDPETAWVFPMDGGGDWPRTSPQAKPAVYGTRDGGNSWTRFDNGLPKQQAWWTVKRQAMCADDGTPVGLYFGTTNGELWGSTDEGESFSCIFRHLPQIYAVEHGHFA